MDVEASPPVKGEPTVKGERVVPAPDMPCYHPKRWQLIHYAFGAENLSKFYTSKEGPVKKFAHSLSYANNMGYEPQLNGLKVRLHLENCWKKSHCTPTATR